MPRASRAISWVKDVLGLFQPAWTSEPPIPVLETIARVHLSIAKDVPCVVSFFAQGGFNKLYTIDVSGRTYLIRVALPVEPRLKTLSEVSTIDFVRTHATELIPRVIAYKAEITVADEDGLGFEWMIMEKIPGEVLENRWNSIDWEAKVLLVKTLVGVLAKLFGHPMSGIGNLYYSDSSFEVGQIVSMAFFWENHFDQDVPRGPFRSSYDWLRAHLTFVLNDSAAILNRPIIEGEDSEEDEEEREAAERYQTLANRLISLLPRIFSVLPDDAPSEMTMIHHDDISFHNLLVDDAGRLTGILDWECVSALPVWRGCTFPSFLSGPPRDEKPDVAGFIPDDDNPGKPPRLYFEHLREWEQTQLRQVFLDEMQRLQPDWVRAYRESAIKNDFCNAVLYCDVPFRNRYVRLWLDRVELMTDEELRGGPGEGYLPLEYERWLPM
ncbi:hypothetical protein NP233_g5670 [Leucocoprinus birnbaumii]|uniref:Aminoglycoside phosphotransferase domain-containing protein n=1 Tax=Leucocoprinus birnbaumii TaxID=56174 RepID=A0AAD5VUQ9_9AGAR|nr:hypothetical protein NP233_g5670 [Leucocoprinus birnbaumii]